MSGIYALAAFCATVFAPIFGADGWSGSEGITDSSTFSVGNFLNSGANNLQTWAGIIIIIFGVVAIIVAVYKLVTGLMSHGKKETSWVVVILLFLVGGVCVYGGWTMVAGQIAAGLMTTANNWGAQSASGAALALLGL